MALGYIEAQPAERERAAALCRRENKWNLVRVYNSAWRFGDALPLLEELHAEAPERVDFTLALADCQLRLGLFEEARATTGWVVESRPESPAAHFLLGKIAFEQRRFGESLKHFEAAESGNTGPPELYTNIGLAYLKLRRWSDAARAFERALEVDPHSAIAHQGLSRVCLRLGRFEEAAERALASVACRHDLPLSHFWLGLALMRLGQPARAIQAFETSLSFQPPLRISHRMLAGLYGDTPQGRLHAQAAKDFIRQRQDQLRRTERIKQEARHRAIDRRETESPQMHGGETADSLAGPALEFVIVSGLPRSGTSLMMRMLEAAGLPVMSDGQRHADEDNPEGYYEWEAIKTIASRPGILREAEGKAIKVVSLLLPSLPKGHKYKVIFMDRPVAEAVASQSKMIRNRGVGEAAAAPEKMAQMLTDHRNEILRGLKNGPGFEVLVVDYPDLVRNPGLWLPRIEAFLGSLPAPGAMGAAIRQDLYRNRG